MLKVIFPPLRALSKAGTAFAGPVQRRTRLKTSVKQTVSRAFSSEVGPGSRKENASKQKARASVPIQSERQRL
jgi:hypothetical protein